MVGEGLDVDPRRTGRDHEDVREQERLLDIEQDDVGALLVEHGIRRHPGHFDTVLYDGVSCLFKGSTISSPPPSV